MREQAVDSVLGAIGHTPLVALDRIRENEKVKPRIFAKLEYYSPGGSVKDRVALKIIEEAERTGKLKAGQTIVELTSGNMGIGLAVASAIKGYRFTAVMSKGNTPERWKILRAFGADVVLVPQAEGGVPGSVSREDLELVEKKTQAVVKRTKAFRPDQFVNPNNPRAHEEGTGEEIWSQTTGTVGYFVALVGTGGTFIGTARALKRHDRSIRCYAVEPKSAPVLAGKPITSTKHKLQGGGYAFVPGQWDPKLCDGYIGVSDSEAVKYARMLARKEGVLSGFSGGANVAAAVKLAKKVGRDKCVVTIIPDTGLKYLSTDLFE
jgi:cysteine synthase